MTIQWKAILQISLISHSVKQTLNSSHSNKSHLPILSRGSVYYAVQGGINL